MRGRFDDLIDDLIDLTWNDPYSRLIQSVCGVHSASQSVSGFRSYRKVHGVGRPTYTIPTGQTAACIKHAPVPHCSPSLPVMAAHSIHKLCPEPPISTRCWAWRPRATDAVTLALLGNIKISSVFRSCRSWRPVILGHIGTNCGCNTDQTWISK